MTVRGLSNLQRKIEALKYETRAQIEKAMELAAQDIVDLARALVPIDEMTLYDSIGWTWGEPPKGSITLARSRRKPSDGFRITVYAGDDKAYYARWVEFGTQPHNTAFGGGTAYGKRQLAGGGGLGHPGARAQPFFFPAYRASRKRARSRITRAINAAAKRQAKGG